MIFIYRYIVLYDVCLSLTYPFTSFPLKYASRFLCISSLAVSLTLLLSAFSRLTSSTIFFFNFLALYLLLASHFLSSLPIRLIMKLLSCANVQRLPQFSDYKFMETAHLNRTLFFFQVVLQHQSNVLWADESEKGKKLWKTERGKDATHT